MLLYYMVSVPAFSVCRYNPHELVGAFITNTIYPVNTSFQIYGLEPCTTGIKFVKLKGKKKKGKISQEPKFINKSIVLNLNTITYI